MKLLVLILVLLIGCGGDKKYTLHEKIDTKRVMEVKVDRMFSEREKVSIDKAIGQWNMAMNGAIEVKVIDKSFNMDIRSMEETFKTGGLLVLRISSGSTLIAIEDKKTLAFTDKIGGNVVYVVSDRIESLDMEGVVMHEMGHIFGIRHRVRGLMQPSYVRKEYGCIDKEAVEELERVMGVRGMNYCL